MATLYLRNVDAAVVREAKMAAAARGITLAEYFDRLVNLHQLAKLYPKRADVGDLLTDAKLEEVSR